MLVEQGQQAADRLIGLDGHDIVTLGTHDVRNLHGDLLDCLACELAPT